MRAAPLTFALGRQQLSHHLFPFEGSPYLKPDEVARRLREEFTICEVDREAAYEIVGDMIAKLIQLKAPQTVIDRAVAGRAGSLMIFIADDEQSAKEVYLNLNVRPDDGILIGYSSRSHEQSVWPLVERCAKALNYEIHLV